MRGTSSSRDPLRRAQVMLIGFGDTLADILTDYLSELALEARVCTEPYDGMATMVDEPGNWLGCIVNGDAFRSADDLHRYLWLFRFEAQCSGIILCNAKACRDESPETDLAMAAADLLDRRRFERAIGSLLLRRGQGAPDIDRIGIPTAAAHPKPHRHPAWPMKKRRTLRRTRRDQHSSRPTCPPPSAVPPMVMS